MSFNVPRQRLSLHQAVEMHQLVRSIRLINVFDSEVKSLQKSQIVSATDHIMWNENSIKPLTSTRTEYIDLKKDRRSFLQLLLSMENDSSGSVLWIHWFTKQSMSSTTYLSMLRSDFDVFSFAEQSTVPFHCVSSRTGTLLSVMFSREKYLPNVLSWFRRNLPIQPDSFTHLWHCFISTFSRCQEFEQRAKCNALIESKKLPVILIIYDDSRLFSEEINYANEQLDHVSCSTIRCFPRNKLHLMELLILFRDKERTEEFCETDIASVCMRKWIRFLMRSALKAEVDTHDELLLLLQHCLLHRNLADCVHARTQGSVIMGPDIEFPFHSADTSSSCSLSPEVRTSVVSNVRLYQHNELYVPSWLCGNTAHLNGVFNAFSSTAQTATPITQPPPDLCLFCPLWFMHVFEPTDGYSPPAHVYAYNSCLGQFTGSQWTSSSSRLNDYLTTTTDLSSPSHRWIVNYDYSSLFSVTKESYRTLFDSTSSSSSSPIASAPSHHFSFISHLPDFPVTEADISPVFKHASVDGKFCVFDTGDANKYVKGFSTALRLHAPDLCSKDELMKMTDAMTTVFEAGKTGLLPSVVVVRLFSLIIACLFGGTVVSNPRWLPAVPWKEVLHQTTVGHELLFFCFRDSDGTEKDHHPMPLSYELFVACPCSRTLFRVTGLFARTVCLFLSSARLSDFSLKKWDTLRQSLDVSLDCLVHQCSRQRTLTCCIVSPEVAPSLLFRHEDHWSAVAQTTCQSDGRGGLLSMDRIIFAISVTERPIVSIAHYYETVLFPTITSLMQSFESLSYHVYIHVWQEAVQVMEEHSQALLNCPCEVTLVENVPFIPDPFDPPDTPPDRGGRQRNKLRQFIAAQEECKLVWRRSKCVVTCDSTVCLDATIVRNLLNLFLLPRLRPFQMVSASLHDAASGQVLFQESLHTVTSPQPPLKEDPLVSSALLEVSSCYAACSILSIGSYCYASFGENRWTTRCDGGLGTTHCEFLHFCRTLSTLGTLGLSTSTIARMHTGK